jgi:hypothetical protein
VGGLRSGERGARLLRPPLDARGSGAPCHERLAAPWLRRSEYPHALRACGKAARPRRSGLLLALGLVFGSPLLAADEIAPAEAELLLFLAEFVDADGDVPELGLLEQAAGEEPNVQQMNATPAAATVQPATGRSEHAPRPINTDRPRLRGRAEHDNE